MYLCPHKRWLVIIGSGSLLHTEQHRGNQMSPGNELAHFPFTPSKDISSCTEKYVCEDFMLCCHASFFFHAVVRKCVNKSRYEHSVGAINRHMTAGLFLAHTTEQTNHLPFLFFSCLWLKWTTHDSGKEKRNLPRVHFNIYCSACSM